MKQNTNNGFIRYAGAGFQMLGSLGFCIWLGLKIDEKWSISPVFTLIGCFLGLGSSMYLLIKDLYPKDR